MTRKRKFLWWASSIVLFVGLVFALAALTEWPTNLLMAPLVLDEPLRPSDTIIVLGAGSRVQSPHLPPQASARVQEGVTLLDDGWAPRLIVAGGYSMHTHLTEAPLMAEAAIADGALSTAVIQEPESRDTWENATNSLAIMKTNGWKTAIVVTSPYHTWRACHIFRKQQADVRCVAAPMRTEASHTPYERLMDFRSVVREYGAIVYFFLKHDL